MNTFSNAIAQTTSAAGFRIPQDMLQAAGKIAQDFGATSFEPNLDSPTLLPERQMSPFPDLPVLPEAQPEPQSAEQADSAEQPALQEPLPQSAEQVDSAEQVPPPPAGPPPSHKKRSADSAQEQPAKKRRKKKAAPVMTTVAQTAPTMAQVMPAVPQMPAFNPALMGMMGNPATAGNPALMGMTGNPALMGMAGNPALMGMAGNPAMMQMMMQMMMQQQQQMQQQMQGFNPVQAPVQAQQQPAVSALSLCPTRGARDCLPGASEAYNAFVTDVRDIQPPTEVARTIKGEKRVETEARYAQEFPVYKSAMLAKGYDVFQVNKTWSAGQRREYETLLSEHLPKGWFQHSATVDYRFFSKLMGRSPGSCRRTGDSIARQLARAVAQV